MHPRILIAALALVLALGSSGRCQEDSALLVTVRFVGDTIELVKKEPATRPVPKQYGIPQFSPLFFEVTGDKGQVIYAGTVGDPRRLVLEVFHQGKIQPGKHKIVKTDLTLTIPADPDARELTIYKRIVKDDEDDRQQLLKVSL